MKPIDRRKFLGMLGKGALGFATTASLFKSKASAERAVRKKPNIVFILIDDMGHKDLGCCGSNFYQTPNIDQLAAEGMRFTRAYSACCVCSPSRVAIFSGKYPARTDFTNVVIGPLHESPIVYDIGKMSEEKLAKMNVQTLDAKHLRVMPQEEVTFAEVLRDHGYQTAFFGKWHCGYHPNFHPDKQGFDTAQGFRDVSSSTVPHWGKNWKKLVKGCPDLKDDDYFPDYLADKAIGFIKQNHDRPFMVTLSHYLVHKPLVGKAELVEKYKNIPGDDQDNPIYAAMVESVDQSVGKITKTLQQLKIDEDTIIIFTSDNGGLSPRPTSNLPLLGGKSFAYEAGTRVPMIIKWPNRTKPASVSRRRVMGIDIYPTVLEMAGAKPPKPQTLDGLSLVPLLTQESTFKERPLFWHYPHYTHATGPYSSIIDEHFKLIRYYNTDNGGEYELYDLKKDPYEYTDLMNTHSDKAEELKARLLAWLKETNAQLPRPQKEYDHTKPTTYGKDYTKQLGEKERRLLINKKNKAKIRQ